MAVLALLLAVAATAWLALGDRLNADALRESHGTLMEWRRSQGLLAVVLFFAATAVAALVSLPGIAVFTLAGGLMFGTLGGTLIVTTAATLGATGLYLLVRAGVGDGLWRRLSAGRAATVAAELKRNEVKALLLFRLAPVMPFFLANALPAIMGVRPGRYALTTFAGLLPGTATLALAGSHIGRLASPGDEPALATLAALIVGVPLLVVGTALVASLLRR